MLRQSQNSVDVAGSALDGEKKIRLWQQVAKTWNAGVFGKLEVREAA